jgi:hypothetical protein
MSFLVSIGPGFGPIRSGKADIGSERMTHIVQPANDLGASYPNPSVSGTA